MRKFLVVLDDTRECLNAMRFAALRAAHTGGAVQILSIIPPEEYQHWMGVKDLMRAEARERIEAHFEVFAKWMRDKLGVDPELIIREGDPATEILQSDFIDKVVVTDTLPIPEDKRWDRLEVLSIAPTIANAIREVFGEGSVTAMFDGAA